jgi:uncharacterized repeat protein (TIGR03803 family)
LANKLKNITALIFLLGLTLQSNAQSGLIGMAYSGGEEFGAIYQTNLLGENHQILHQFSGVSGSFPYYTRLKEIKNGLFIGMTSQGGFNNHGVVFLYNMSDSSYRKILDFNGQENGSNPRGSLNFGNDGFLYGMTSSGGDNNMGIIFKIDTSNYQFIKLHDFDENNSGRSPYGDLSLANDGNFYGMTYQGGNFGSGVLFQFNPNNSTLVKKIDFNGNNNGRNPFGSLMQASDNHLYGLTYQGGSSNLGLLFQYNISNDSFKIMVEFDGVNKGGNPHSSLIQVNHHTLMGTTFLGGIDNAGVLFSYNLQTQTLSKKQDFGSAVGRNPYGSLLLASDSNVYGLAFQGGSFNAGSIYQYRINTDSFKVIKYFSEKGRNPYGALSQSENGDVYGMTYRGGNINSGVIFSFNLNDFLVKKEISFNQALLGKHPFGNLSNLSLYDFYGMTQKGGRFDQGVIFYFNAEKNQYEKKFDFDGVHSGGLPHGNLCLAKNNKYYGLTNTGGAYNLGTLFEYDYHQNIFTKIIDFDGLNNGKNPYGGFCVVNDSILYGLTSLGGKDDFGIIFSYNLNQQKIFKLIEFDDTFNGSTPFGELLKVDSLYYGLTFQGGKNELGVLFEFNPSLLNLKPLFHFDGIQNGSYPQGNLIKASNHKLYGLTQAGGSQNNGVIFEYDYLNSTFSKLHDFNQISGKTPTGSLIETNEGLLIGKTSKGGLYDLGVIFNYNYLQSNFQKTIDFNSIIGSTPFGGFSKLCLPNRVTIDTSGCDSFISASGNYIYKLSGIYNDTIVTTQGCDSIITYHLRIKNSTNSFFIVKECFEYLSPVNTILDSSGRYLFNIDNYMGCDSIITIELIIQNTKNKIVKNECLRYVAPNQQVFDSSGVYTVIIPNHLNCDSIITIDLHIIKNNINVIQTQNLLVSEIDSATYQWVDCKNQFKWLDGKTSKQYLAENNGSYAVIIQKNNCTDTSICYDVNNLMIKNTSSHKTVQVFPNPNNGEFTIQSDDLFHYTVLDLTSKIILNDSNKSNRANVRLNPGVYFIHIFQHEKTFIEKLIVW